MESISVRAVLLCFALGVAWLQQQAVLPGWGGWAACIAILCVTAGAGFVVNGRGRIVAFAVAAAAIGFAYAAVRAEMRLQQHLPVEFEQRDIELSGFVRGLPEPQDEGTRFLFEVESNGARLRDFPRIVRLLWAQDAPGLVAGQRWALTARLKRPHANANFSLRDGEVGLLERGIRATGSVSVSRPARLLPGDVIGPWLAIDRWRARIRRRIETVLADAPHRGVVVALAVGAQDAVSDGDWAVLRATGTSHLVAISGLHIGFVAGLAAFVCGFVWKRVRLAGVPAPLVVAAPKVAALGAASFAALYAALAGFNVPAQRTLWTLVVFAIAFVGGRRPASSLVLAWALAFVLIADPWAVTSPGFWLSFCAVAAILHAITSNGRRASKAPRDDADDWLAGLEARDPVLPDEVASSRTVADSPPRGCSRSLTGASGRAAANAFPDEAGSSQAVTDPPPRTRSWSLVNACRRAAVKVRGHLASSARVQYAVTLSLAPLTAYWFSQIPLIGPLANAFAIPWISFVVTPATLAALIAPAPLDAPMLHFAHAALSVLFDALEKVADAGPAWSLWYLPQPGMFAMAASLTGAAWALAPRGWPLRFAVPLTWLPLLVPASSGVSQGTFRVTALDIGQGSALVVETAHHTLLFDAGPGPESTHAGERIVAPYLIATGVRSLDALVVSHSDSDHAGGAPAVLQAVVVRQLLASLPANHALWSDAGRRGADTLRCAAGQHWTWDRVDFRVLWPDPGPLTGTPNHQACVMKVTNAAGRTALFTADMEADVERTLLARDPAALRADVLIVPHHGSRTSSTEPFLDSVGPLAAVFQVGYRNRFHHPNPTVYARYQMRDIALTRSDEDGAARIDIGSEVVLDRYRQTHARYWMGR
ncbi:ComEC/Rec2 family competence protein [Caballeronia sp. LZ062]|uniref:ComEC/Rec2 family competence protein n=1 Tax=unclassified Caballeronia TaxID=2646786 RepID=UPI002866352E|nr:MULTISPECIES: ComEC/Rec2 family competence protein [unclassified Caballeronia]MDR5854872.1 ComEC/Rec2 family competence protein [Caballeronia sp. LZ050]MDR5870599.1 ComEC/Rec2 family competence protein [Caballeronia sp. LZ062]